MNKIAKQPGPIAGGPRAVADRYDISIETVRRLVCKGSLPASKFGQRVLIRLSDSDALFLAGSNKK
jgi:excisionase family DNA binding protein